jgi:hypothetical protein
MIPRQAAGRSGHRRYTVEFFIIFFVVLIFLHIPGKHDRFQNARIGCSSLGVNMNPEGHHTCDLLTKHRVVEAPARCTYEDCPKRKGGV